MTVKDFMLGCGILGTAIMLPSVAQSMEVHLKDNALRQLHAANNNRKS